MNRVNGLGAQSRFARLGVAGAVLLAAQAVGCGPTNTRADGTGASGAGGANAASGAAGGTPGASGGNGPTNPSGGAGTSGLGSTVGGSSGSSGSSGAGESAGGGACQSLAPAAQPQVIPGEVADVTASCGVNGNAPPLLGPRPLTTPLSLTIGLVSNDQALDDYAMQVSDPSSPLYRHYLTPEQIADMFGPSVCNYQALIDWAKAHGLTTSSSTSRLLLGVNGTVAQISAALHVTFQNYQRRDGSVFYAPDRDPSIDFSVPLSAISGLDNCFVPTPVLGTVPPFDAGAAGAGD